MSYDLKLNSKGKINKYALLPKTPWTLSAAIMQTMDTMVTDRHHPDPDPSILTTDKVCKHHEQ